MKKSDVVCLQQRNLTPACPETVNCSRFSVQIGRAWILVNVLLAIEGGDAGRLLSEVFTVENRPFLKKKNQKNLPSMFVVKVEIDCNGYASLIYVFSSEKCTCSWSSSLLCSRWISTRFMFNTKWKSLTKDCAVEKHIYFETKNANVRKFKSLHARDKVRQRWGDGKTTSQFEVERKRKNGEMWKPRRIESFYWDLAAHIYNDT